MIKIENIETYGWEAAVRGMRNPMNSWEKSDSAWCDGTTVHDSMMGSEPDCDTCEFRNVYDEAGCFAHIFTTYVVGPNDAALMRKLAKAGPDHGKFLRMLNITMDITAPLYWWKEYDTYKIGTVANSCSTMHKIMAKEFVREDFSFEKISGVLGESWIEDRLTELNYLRARYLNFDKEKEGKTTTEEIWYALIQMLPSSYNQKRTVQLNYAVLKNIYRARKTHKLKEWRMFCKEIERLPYNDLFVSE